MKNSFISYRTYIIPCLMVFFMIIAMLFHGAIIQPSNYHDFADNRAFLGIHHAADVLSNIGFALVSIWGLLSLFQNPQQGKPARLAYILFFICLMLTALGSTWYHLAPDNERLIFDRIPIAMACVILLAAVWQECNVREEKLVRNGLIYIGLICMAYASVWWWQNTNRIDDLGDLRPYLLLQVMPLILIPIIQWQAKINPLKRWAFGVTILLYVIAKITELQDHAIFHQLIIISGHTLKHILAALAAGILVWQVRFEIR